MLAAESAFGSSNDAFYFDAIVFKGDSAGSYRLDTYIMVPAQSLEFTSQGDRFSAGYSIYVTISDSIKGKVKEESISGSFKTKDFNEAQGANAEFKNYYRSYYLNPGKYDIQVMLFDNESKKEFIRSRSITVLNFSDFDFSLSGILLLSSIEEKEGRFIITPFISDNVAQLKESFFAFFESYKTVSNDTVDFIYELINSQNKILFQSKRIPRLIEGKVSRQYIKIDKPSDLAAGTYTLQIIALRHSLSEPFTEKDYLAVAQRSIRLAPTLSGSVIADLAQSIRQLRFVANQEELDNINDAETREEKLKRFEIFWNKIDPTPNTDRNEAFDEYYARIQYANANFRSYTEGWMTDKGMVFIVFGQPMNMERYPSGYGDNRIYERWTYRTGREFIFLDNTGFGDFRLVRPIAITEKYKYSTN